MNDGVNGARLLEDIKLTATSLGLSSEYRYYILICGIFTSERNIVKHWPHYEKVFLDLITLDGSLGIKHLFQAIIQYFMNKYPDMQKYAGTFMKLIYDQNVFDIELIIGFQDKRVKLDKDCALYDRKAQRHFRKLIKQFVDWLK